MKILIESTSKLVTLTTPDGSVPARIWEGMTDTGIAVHAFVTRIAVNRTDDASQFEAELLETRSPSPLVDESYPSSLVL
jgi:hypothetical protein